MNLQSGLLRFSRKLSEASLLAACALGIGSLALPGLLPVAHAATPSCTANPVAPYVSGGTIYGVSSVSCTTTVNEIRITSSLSRNGGPTINNTVTCYNASSCAAISTTPYLSGAWSTTAMGYAYNGLTWTSTRSSATVTL